MKAISTIIATVLLVIITISLVSTSYLFFGSLITGWTSKPISLIHARGHTITVRNDGTDTIDENDIKVIVNNKEVEIINSEAIEPKKSKVLKFIPPDFGNELRSAKVFVVGPSNSLTYTTNIIPHAPKVTSDTVGLWHFDSINGTGHTLDETDNHNDGQIIGDTYLVTDMFGSCLNFDGIGDHVNIGDKDTLDMGISNFTIGAWIKTTDFSKNTIVSKHGGGVNPGYHIEINNGRINFLAGDGSSSVSETRGSGYNDDNWYFIVLTFDHENVAKTYADGSQVGADIDVSALGNLDNTYQFRIGDYSGGTYEFNGRIDEVTILNKALTQEEIIDSIYG